MAKKSNPLLDEADKFIENKSRHWLAKTKRDFPELGEQIEDLIRGYVLGEKEYTSRFQSQSHLARLIHSKIPKEHIVQLREVKNSISDWKREHAS